jgi:hypothetical protein
VEGVTVAVPDYLYKLKGNIFLFNSCFEKQVTFKLFLCIGASDFNVFSFSVLPDDQLFNGEGQPFIFFPPPPMKQSIVWLAALQP